MAWSKAGMGRAGKYRELIEVTEYPGMSSAAGSAGIQGMSQGKELLLSFCTALKGKMGSSHLDPGWNVPGVCGAGNAESFQVEGGTRAENLAGREGIWQPAKCRIYMAGLDVIHLSSCRI